MNKNKNTNKTMIFPVLSVSPPLLAPLTTTSSYFSTPLLLDSRFLRVFFVCVSGSARARLLAYVDAFQLSIGAEDEGGGGDDPLGDSTDPVPQKPQAVSLMTVHASKGLEFDCVIISGLEDGCLPSKGTLQQVSVRQRAVGASSASAEAEAEVGEMKEEKEEEEEKETVAGGRSTPNTPTTPVINVGTDAHSVQNQLNEERRVLYVGMTRARKQLILTYRQKNVLGRRHIPLQPSRFLSDMPEGVEFLRATGS